MNQIHDNGRDVLVIYIYHTPFYVSKIHLGWMNIKLRILFSCADISILLTIYYYITKHKKTVYPSAENVDIFP